MKPRLLSISGPIRGAEFPLNRGELAIGRDSSNAIWLDHQSVSRRHCRICAEEIRFTIFDLDSRNRTLVNRTPVTERELAEGDEVQIGECVFLFLIKAPVAMPDPSALTDESKLLTRSIVVKPEDSTHGSAARLTAELEAAGASGTAARIARELNSLLAASEAIHSLRTTESIARQVLRSAFEGTPADRGAVLLFDADEASEGWVFGWEREMGAAAAANNYRWLIEQVKDEGARCCARTERRAAPRSWGLLFSLSKR